MRDLSIRGAGDVLGSEQAGFIDSVGMDLFLEMLNEEVERKKGNNKEIIKVTLNPQKMNLIDGEQLFFKANNLSKSIRFASREEKLIITLDIVHLEKHYIFYLIELMEILNECVKK